MQGGGRKLGLWEYVTEADYQCARFMFEIVHPAYAYCLLGKDPRVRADELLA